MARERLIAAPYGEELEKMSRINVSDDLQDSTFALQPQLTEETTRTSCYLPSYILNGQRRSRMGSWTMRTDANSIDDLQTHDRALE